MKRVWLYADPAWGEKGCYKAVISIGYDGNRFYVIHAWIRLTENTKFFRYYYDDNHLPPISHRIKRIDNKENKNLRIERTETIIETAKVLFPDGQDTPP